jgi:16S rRNA (guanine527-N7)-methyltransferase
MDARLAAFTDDRYRIMARLNPDRETQLRAYLDAVLRANEQFNLTAVRDPEAAWARHVLDSLEGLSTTLFEGEKKVIDIGSGAGFPGTVLAIARPQLEVVLLESIGKKCRFLEEATALHAPNARVLCARAEDAGHDEKLRERFDVGVARAVGSLSEVCELTLPFVKTGGSLLLWRGPNAAAEIGEAKKALTMLGGRARVLESYRLPGNDVDYHLVLVEKRKETSSRFPRRAGLPKQKPL